MSQLYNLTMLRDNSSPPKEPSSLGSGLGETSADLSIPSTKTAVEVMPASTVGPNGDPGPETKKVVVVGAGISGLRAAAVLKCHGLDVEVVEGRDRIGGRIHTTHSDKGPRDMGMCAKHKVVADTELQT